MPVHPIVCQSTRPLTNTNACPLQVVGGTGFIISSWLFMLETQPNWHTPSPKTLGWHIGLWNLIGALGFTLCGALGFASGSSQACETASLWSTFIGSWAFLVRILFCFAQMPFRPAHFPPVVIVIVISEDIPACGDGQLAYMFAQPQGPERDEAETPNQPCPMGRWACGTRLCVAQGPCGRSIPREAGLEQDKTHHPNSKAATSVPKPY